MITTAPRQSVFLSYPRNDSKTAASLRDLLVGAGVDVWFEQSDLVPGSNWQAAQRKPNHGAQRS